MKIRCFDIKWDTDGEEVDLPTETVLEVEDDFDLDQETADALSDKFGWCVFSVDVERLKLTPEEALKQIADCVSYVPEEVEEHFDYDENFCADRETILAMVDSVRGALREAGIEIPTEG